MKIFFKCGEYFFKWNLESHHVVNIKYLKKRVKLEKIHKRSINKSNDRRNHTRLCHQRSQAILISIFSLFINKTLYDFLRQIRFNLILKSTFNLLQLPTIFFDFICARFLMIQQIWRFLMELVASWTFEFELHVFNPIDSQRISSIRWKFRGVNNNSYQFTFLMNIHSCF